MSKNPNAHFIEVAKIALRLNGLDMHNPIQAIELSIGLATLAALAQIALKKEQSTYRDSNGRPVVDMEAEGTGVDAFFYSATYEDDGSKVSDDELDYLTETYPETIEEHCSENFAKRCEDSYDASRGH